MVPLPLAPAPTTYLAALSLVACDSGTFTRMSASQLAVPGRAVCVHARLPTAYRTVPAGGGAAAVARAGRGDVVVAAVALAAVRADPATAAATAATVSQ